MLSTSKAAVCAKAFSSSGRRSIIRILDIVIPLDKNITKNLIVVKGTEIFLDFRTPFKLNLTCVSKMGRTLWGPKPKRKELLMVNEKIIYEAVESSGIAFTKANDGNRLAFEIYRRMNMFPEDTLKETVDKAMEISMKEGITEINAEDWDKLEGHLVTFLQEKVGETQ